MAFKSISLIFMSNLPMNDTPDKDMTVYERVSIAQFIRMFSSDAVLKCQGFRGGVNSLISIVFVSKYHARS